VVVIQRGYGEVKLVNSSETIAGEITLHAEGWVAVTPVPASGEPETRWFPNHCIAEVVWRKSAAMRQSR